MNYQSRWKNLELVCWGSAAQVLVPVLSNGLLARVIDGWGVHVLSLLPNEKMLTMQKVKILLGGRNDNPMKYRYPFMGFSLHFHCEKIKFYWVHPMKFEGEQLFFIKQ